MTERLPLSKYELGIDLSSFYRLLNFTWKGLRPEHMETLCVVLQNNSTHLKTLELDFVNLMEISNNHKDERNDNDGHNDSDASNFDLDSATTSLSFPDIRTLSLSQVPLTESIAPVLNFDTLVSLKLRLCSSWDVVIRRILKLNHPIKLRSLEIQDAATISHGLGEGAILDLVNGFDGLEELFVSHQGKGSALELWVIVACRHPALKRFVCHQRTVVANQDSQAFGRWHDLSNLGIGESDMCRIAEDPLQNPLAKRDLEFIGLSSIPELMVSISDLPGGCRLTLFVIGSPPATLHIQDFTKGNSHPSDKLRLTHFSFLGAARIRPS